MRVAARFLPLVVLIQPACRSNCEELSVGECEDDSECAVIGGQPADAENMCFGEGAAAGCTEKGRVCGQAITYATDPRGTVWRFSNTCTPEGWGQPKNAALGEWPNCSAP